LAKQWLKRRSATPLLIAAKHGMFRTISSLLSTESLDVNARTIYKRLTGGKTEANALYAAALNGRLETVKVLLENGADPMIGTSDGDTPLQAAIWKNHMAITELLLRYRASDLGDTSSSPLLQGEAAVRALHIAATAGNFEVTRLLIGNSDLLNTLGDDDYSFITRRVKCQDDARITEILSKLLAPVKTTQKSSEPGG
jgi:ankyrin repeat protein